MVIRTCNAYFDALPVGGGEVAYEGAMLAALTAVLAPDPAQANGLRVVAKRNLRSLIERESDDTALMLKCLEELS